MQAENSTQCPACDRCSLDRHGDRQHADTDGVSLEIDGVRPGGMAHLCADHHCDSTQNLRRILHLRLPAAAYRYLLHLDQHLPSHHHARNDVYGQSKCQQVSVSGRYALCRHSLTEGYQLSHEAQLSLTNCVILIIIKKCSNS